MLVNGAQLVEYATDHQGSRIVTDREPTVGLLVMTLEQQQCLIGTLESTGGMLGHRPCKGRIAAAQGFQGLLAVDFDLCQRTRPDQHDENQGTGANHTRRPARNEIGKVAADCR